MQYNIMLFKICLFLILSSYIQASGVHQPLRALKRSLSDRGTPSPTLVQPDLKRGRSDEGCTLGLSRLGEGTLLRDRHDGCGAEASIPVKLCVPSFWEKVSSGEHSFRKLGEVFYKECSMIKVNGARVVCFNDDLAKKLQLPQGANIEETILNNFAYITRQSARELIEARRLDIKLFDEEKTKQFFATYYQDSERVDRLEDSKGDGRAVWTGELNVQGKYYDFVVKGIGKTGLQPERHSDPAHIDGIQSLDEAIFSYKVGIYLNKAFDVENSAQDLAVIELPFSKTETDGSSVPAAITIRVGNHMRMGHLAYWCGKPEFERIFTYSINRALGRDSEEVSGEVFSKYKAHFIDNLAQTAALLYTNNLMHGSPTKGNLTCEGLFIDNGTWNQLDTFHPSFLFGDGKYVLRDQVTCVKDYIRDLDTYLDQGVRPDYVVGTGQEDLDVFDREYEARRKSLILFSLFKGRERHLEESQKDDIARAYIAFKEEEKQNKFPVTIQDKKFSYTAKWCPELIVRNYLSLLKDYGEACLFSDDRYSLDGYDKLVEGAPEWCRRSLEDVFKLEDAEGDTKKQNITQFLILYSKALKTISSVDSAGIQELCNRILSLPELRIKGDRKLRILLQAQEVELPAAEGGGSDGGGAAATQ
jgi:hypothetical protein